MIDGLVEKNTAYENETADLKAKNASLTEAFESEKKKKADLTRAKDIAEFNLRHSREFLQEQRSQHEILATIRENQIEELSTQKADLTAQKKDLTTQLVKANVSLESSFCHDFHDKE